MRKWNSDYKVKKRGSPVRAHKSVLPLPVYSIWATMDWIMSTHVSKRGHLMFSLLFQIPISGGKVSNIHQVMDENVVHIDYGILFSHHKGQMLVTCDNML